MSRGTHMFGNVNVCVIVRFLDRVCLVRVVVREQFVSRTTPLVCMMTPLVSMMTPL